MTELKTKIILLAAYRTCINMCLFWNIFRTSLYFNSSNVCFSCIIWYVKLEETDFCPKYFVTNYIDYLKIKAYIEYYLEKLALKNWNSQPFPTLPRESSNGRSASRCHNVHACHKSSRRTNTLRSQNAAVVCVVAGRVQGDAEGSRLRERDASAGGRRGSKQSAGRRERRRRRRQRKRRRGRHHGGCPRLRRLRKGDRRALVSKGGRSRMALRLPALLSLPSPSGRRAHLLRQGRQHLLQGGLL